MSKPKAIIFDLDGTLADNSHRQHYVKKDENGHYSKDVDWKAYTDACDEDLPNKDIIELFQLYDLHGSYALIICSGRDESARSKTQDWLCKHGVDYDELHMRPSNDYRPDEVLKSEMLDNLLNDYDIRMCVDDRDKVVKMWRNRGIRCLQVAKGDF